MPSTPHEDRFTALMHFAAGDAGASQELSIPRKARRLDLVYCFDSAPVWFGPLQVYCHQRVVHFEHESAPLARHAVTSAMVGQSWLAWERVRPRGARRQLDAARQELRATARPPLTIVVADSLREDLSHAVPTLSRRRASGVWHTEDLDHGGLIVLDTSALRPDQGYAFWSWVGKPRDPEQARDRLNRLLDEPALPISSREHLMEALMSNQIPHTDTESESVYQRLRRTFREEGERRGLQEGERRGLQEGERRGRNALLALASRFAPQSIEDLRGIMDLDKLEQAVERAIRDAARQ